MADRVNPLLGGPPPEILLGRSGQSNALLMPPEPPLEQPNGLLGLAQRIFGSAMTGDYWSRGGRRDVEDYASSMARTAGEQVLDLARHPENLIGPGNLGIVRIANPIRAYHGSPHLFGHFDMRHIGRGEGSQAYGHGLYFAANEDVARTYRTGQPTGALQQALALVNTAGGDRDAALANIASQLRSVPREYQTYRQGLEEAAEIIRSGRSLSPGHMYEVNLHARPEQFLDWDRPLSGQSAQVRNILEPLRQDIWREWQGVNPTLREPTHMGQILAVRGEEASQRLGGAGIPGLRYLDQGSRAGGAGTSNYVVWNPSIIEMVRRYGLLAPMAGGGAAAMMDQQ